MQEILLKNDILKGDYQKPYLFLKVYFIFSFEPSPYNGQSCQKQGAWN